MAKRTPLLSARALLAHANRGWHTLCSRLGSNVRFSFRFTGTLVVIFAWPCRVLAAGASDGVQQPANASEAPPPVSGVVTCNAPCLRPPRDRDDFRVFGARASETRVDIGGASRDAFGVLVAFEHHGYATLWNLTTRSSDFGLIGGGSGGFEGGIGGDFAFGWRAPFGALHGPFARIGLRGHLLGNDDLYTSILELPVGQLGYQVLDGTDLLVEIAAEAAPVLAGRYNAGDARPRKLGGSLDWGAHAGARYSVLHLEASYAHIADSDSALGPLQILGGTLCGEAAPVALCLDGRYLTGEVYASSAGEIVTARSLYVGALFGVLAQAPR